MSEKKFLATRGTLASAPAGILSRERTVTLRQKQARRPPAAAGSNWSRPLILLGENREPVRVALKNVGESSRLYRAALRVSGVLEEVCSATSVWIRATLFSKAAPLKVLAIMVGGIL